MTNCLVVDNRIPPLGFTGGTDLETRPVGYAYPETAPGSDLPVFEIGAAKLCASQAASRGAAIAHQVHGAMGFTNEVGLTEAWHSLRIVNVADGTNEILNRTIAQRLLKGDLDV